MNRGAAIEYEKMVAWAIGVVLAIVLLMFILAQFREGGGGVMDSILALFDRAG